MELPSVLPAPLAGRRLVVMLIVLGLGLYLSTQAGLAADATDTDADGVADLIDNCTMTHNPDQRDSNGDGYGNRCDADLDNDNQVNFADLAAFKSVFLTPDADADFDGDGQVNFGDLATLKSLFLQPPGPGNGALRTEPVPSQPFVNGDYRVLAANDLGMHCADLDYQVFSILPPFNVSHAQVIRRGTGLSLPSLMSPTAAPLEVVYSATSNPADPALVNSVAPSLVGTARAAVSINSTSRNDPALPDEVYKSNFWTINPATGNTYGYDAYGVLFPGDVLALFDPIPNDLGLPVPDPAALPLLEVTQAAMPSALSRMPFVTAPYAANEPQPFDRFDTDLPFFADFPFGGVIPDVNWWAVDGLPIMPVDDAGRRNPFPLMRIQATLDQVTVATTDVVIPVASEADCQGCHVAPATCEDPRLPPDFAGLECNGAAVSPTWYTSTIFAVAGLDDAPGNTIEQQLLNAAKLNILRLHDALHGAAYETADGSPAPCDGAADADCLTAQQPVSCSQCHYSPALDLAQAGPVDEPSAGPGGRQQTRHITMSRAMHGHHGSLPGLFPDMPPILDAQGDPRPQSVTQEVLEQTCYQCHPGKRTACLRGAMFNGGMVCQDCHGGMEQVGNDFSAAFPVDPFPAGADLTKRVPWASEPACQSCHTGDALTTLAGDPGTLAAPDGIRLLQAWLADDDDATPIRAPASRFAENNALYRVSTGHGGVMCEGCHGSTHAIWPIDDPNANDNQAAIQLQGYAGTLTECSVCHATNNVGLPLGLNGPHGMHPVSDYNGPDHRWNDDHKEYVEGNQQACRACHGRLGQGTVLSKTATDRRLECKSSEGSRCGPDQNFVNVPADTALGCGDCHRNYLLFPD